VLIEQFLEQPGKEVSAVVMIQISFAKKKKKTIIISADGMIILTEESCNFRPIC